MLFSFAFPRGNGLSGEPRRKRKEKKEAVSRCKVKAVSWKKKNRLTSFPSCKYFVLILFLNGLSIALVQLTYEIQLVGACVATRVVMKVFDCQCTV